MANTYIFTGGGTGGHIYPGVAVAEEIQKKDPEAKIIFVGARRGIEKNIFPNLNYDYHLLFIGPLNGVSTIRKMMSLIQLPFSVLYSILLVLLYSPKNIIGFGGYASSPMLIAASLINQKFVMWEGNATPGFVTRKLAAKADNILLAFPSKHNLYKKNNFEVIGVPTRFTAKAEKKNYSDYSGRKARLFVFGGSQGAKSINILLSDFFVKYPDYCGMFEVVHQVGKDKQSQVDDSLKELDSYQVYEFIHDMDKYYDWADFVICRSGASTVSEVNQLGLPAIFIPLPGSADDHQRKNAEWVADSGAGLCLNEIEITDDSLKMALDHFLNCAKLEEMSIKSLGLAQSSASQKIAELIS